MFCLYTLPLANSSQNSNVDNFQQNSFKILFKILMILFGAVFFVKTPCQLNNFDEVTPICMYQVLKSDHNMKCPLSPNVKFFRGFPFKPELLLLLSTSLKWLQKSDISFLIYACQHLIYMVIINVVSTPVEFQLTPLLPLVKVICWNYLPQ